MRALVVAEFYPSRRDPVLGVWAHRQALAARDAGADVRVVVLHRLVPPAASLRDGTWRRELGDRVRATGRERRDGIEVLHVPFVSPPRERGYARWGAWAAPPLALALRAVRPRFAFDVVHAHNAVPAGDALVRAGLRAPLLVSVHGGDVLFTAPSVPGGEAVVRATLAAARMTLANSAGIAALCAAYGARAAGVRVLHLGTDVPARPAVPDDPFSVVTVGHLVARKRHADVLRALALVRDRHPAARYVVIGDGPERRPLERLARELGVPAEFRGQLPHDEAVAAARRCAVFAMPSTEEAFGVAYVEAMAAGLPAIGTRGEPGPEEIGGMLLVAPEDPEALAGHLDALFADPALRLRVGEQGRRVVQERFTWERCGRATVEAYAEAMRA